MSVKYFERVVLLVLAVGLLGGGFALLRARQIAEKNGGRGPKVNFEQSVGNYQERLEETAMLLKTGKLDVSSR